MAEFQGHAQEIRWGSLDTLDKKADTHDNAQNRKDTTT